jgi:hypothetical protein
MASAKLQPVLWEGQEVGSFEYLAVDANGLIFGYWTTTASPRLAAFLEAVREGHEPQVRLARAAGATSFTVLRIEPGRRWRGPEVSRIELIVLGPGMAASTA